MINIAKLAMYGQQTFLELKNWQIDKLTTKFWSEYLELKNWQIHILVKLFWNWKIDNFLIYSLTCELTKSTNWQTNPYWQKMSAVYTSN